MIVSDLKPWKGQGKWSNAGMAGSATKNTGVTMRIEKAEITNFRLLEKVEISFEAVSTVIVGRNNSGKTSLTEVFDRLIGDKVGQFKLEDFSASTRPIFLAAKKLREDGAEAKAVLAALPVISVTLTLSYEAGATDLGPLSDFVIDLDVNCTKAILRVDYRASLATLAVLFDIPALVGDGDGVAHFFRSLRETVPKAYSLHPVAIDPTDPANERALELKHVAALFQYGFVGAQRALDQAKKGDPYVLGKLLETLFQTASTATAAPGDQNIAADLKLAVETVEKQIQSGFNEKLKGLLPTFDKFGYPGLSDPHLRTETALDVGSLLSEHTKVFYTGTHGVHLPEGYNGLGTRNLIYILLQLMTFHKAYRARPTLPGIHLVFIEEPEAHLHPQMQEVFIKQLTDAIATFSEGYPDGPTWQVQFVVSTHSPHLANAASFDSIRYFLTKPADDGLTRHTQVKDFRKGLDTIQPADRKFLHQYMTLTKCDLYFADKTIVIEGTTERLLIPRICQIVDKDLPAASKLAKQYITVLEVSGAHASIFEPLLDFLELRTLIITDLDVVKLNDNKPARWVKCPYSEGVRTNNTTIKNWFDVAEGEQISVEQLREKSPAEKTKGGRRIAYQIHEAGSAFCARSYEDSLILANPDHFQLAVGTHWGDTAWLLAQDMPKTETALRFAIEVPEWNVPLYIREGLIWLSEPPEPAPLPPLEAEMVDPNA
ncbi:energy-coupling factor transporter ATP-binding protein EcfA2 [Variovorax boronicumulans]|uniref:ATP-dependent nuclease n=1 Tax=Variovorax boronicumulans TaxID=436515 RepID=UPI00339269F3